MSLINKMLKDIDQRSSTDQENRPPMLNQVKAVKRSSSDSSRFIVFGLLGASALGLAAYYLSDQLLNTRPKSEMPAPVVTIAPAVPLPAPAPLVNATAASDATATNSGTSAVIAVSPPIALSAEQQVTSLTQDWAAAWSAKNFTAYIGFYSDQFSPTNNMARDQWAESRRVRITRPASISVALSNINAEPIADQQIRVRFTQRYASDNFAETSEKILIWQRTNMDWKIVREEVNQAPVKVAAQEAAIQQQARPKPAPVPLASVTNNPSRAEENIKLPSMTKTPAAAETQTTAQVENPAISKTQTPVQRSDNLYRQGQLLIQQGQLGKAKPLLEQSLETLPTNTDARVLLARLMVDIRLPNEAQALLTEGLRLSPRHQGMLMTLAHLKVQTNNLESAIDTLLKDEPSARANADYQALLAALLQRKNRHQEATQHYLNAVRLSPNNSNWLVGLGISLQAQGVLVGAAEAFQRALELGTLPPALAETAQQRLNQISKM
jgi:MSHA biogenesis protein MshN